MSSVILFKVINSFSKQYNSYLNKNCAGLLTQLSTLPWIEHGASGECFFQSFGDMRWKSKSSYCRLFQLFHIMRHVFPYAFPFTSVVPALVAGWCIPPMAWRAKPSTQVEGIWHSVHFLGVAGVQEPPEAIGCFGSTRLSGTQVNVGLNTASGLEEGSLVPLIYEKWSTKLSCFIFIFGG